MRILSILIVPLLLVGIGSPLDAWQTERSKPQSLQSGPPLPGTVRLESSGDLASDMVDGIDRFLLRQIDASIEGRKKSWPQPDRASSDQDLRKSYQEATASLRQDLRRRIGAIDPRVPASAFIVQGTLEGGRAIAESAMVDLFEVRWPVFPGVDAEGIYWKPKAKPRFAAILLPDPSEPLESFLDRDKPSFATAIYLAQQGGIVLVPQVIDRHREARNGRAQLTDQEYLYRSAFELGRHILGYQVQEAMAAIDLLKKEAPSLPVIALGWGEGGWMSLHLAAIEPRIEGACVSGHFGPREKGWQEPIHRNIHGLLTHFGDAQLGCLIAPRHLTVETSKGPEVHIAGDGGAPGDLHTPSLTEVVREVEIARSILSSWKLHESIELVSEDSPELPQALGRKAIDTTLRRIGLEVIKVPSVSSPSWQLTQKGTGIDSKEVRRERTVAKWNRWNQWLLEHVANERAEYWKKLDTRTLDAFQATVEEYRDYFRQEIIGDWELPRQKGVPRTRKIYEAPQWQGFEVVLDVFPDVFAYGVLLVPKTIDLSDATKGTNPCVVFQHGLEGRPRDVIEGDHAAYHDVAAKLAERGYIVFAPQNCYLFQDRFRTLQRKSNLLGKTLFSTMVAQHQQIVDWLGAFPAIDPNRIGFYGLSYGGKSAMRIPPLVKGYCLSICSADFNDWVWKNASTNSRYSYVWTGEYEIFEFDLGPKFNYAEMATLMAPRPFMVERGHFDGVAPDDRVASEYAKVRHLYAAKLGLAERTEMEWFVGPHTIHGVGTFQFLDRHLRPPR